MEHSSRRPKYINLLVVGSSEVKMFVEGRELLKQEYGVDVRVEYKNGCTLDYCLGQVKRQMRPTTHLIIIWALTPYGWRRTSIRTKGKQEINIFRPAIYFSLRDIPRLMNQIMRYVYEINPQCIVYLAIPAIKDLYTFNQTRIVRAWGENYRDFLQDHVDYNPKQMRKHSVYIYDQFASLYQDKYYWEGKHLIYGNSALNCYVKKRPDAAHHKRKGVEHVQYLQGVTNVLNSDLLPDGLHGNQLFFKYYWIRNKSIFKSIREINNIPPPSEPPVAPPRRVLLGDRPAVTFHTTDEFQRLIPPSSTYQNMDNNEFPDRVSRILHSFTNLDQPSTSRGGLSSQGSFMPLTREEYIASPHTRHCITQMPSYPSFYQNCMPQSFTNTPVFTQYDSDDADADAGISVRDFINERKRKGHSDTGVLIRDLDKVIKNVKKEQEMMKRRRHE